MPPSQLVDDARFDAYRDRRRWVVGFSGGVDSTVLLVLAQAYLQRCVAPSPRLHALHIHHGLSPAADRWQAHCETFCQQRGIAFDAVRVAVQAAGDGPEAAARAARYRAFNDYLRADDLLLLAQHRDDQAETLLLGLMRGSGMQGLRGMPAERAIGAALLARPLLDCTRGELEAFARARALPWVEDESNTDVALSRNFLRHRVLPVLRQHWPQAIDSLATTSDILRQEAGLLAELAAADMRDVTIESSTSALSIDALLSLSVARRANVLRFWLAQFGLRPRRSQLLALENDLLPAADDASPAVVIGSFCLRRHRRELHCIAQQALPGPFRWSPDQPGEIPGWGRLLARPATPGTAAVLRRGDYEVRFRQGGERAQPNGRRHSTALKKLFQEYGVPEWERGCWPLLFDGDTLAAVPGLFVCRGYACEAGEPGWHLERDSIHCAPF